MRDPYGIILINFFLCAILAIVFFIYKKKRPKKKINFLASLIIFSIIPVISIFRSGTYESGDLTQHTILLQSFFESLTQGILIPQWAGRLCAGHGCPVFLYLYTMPFYIGSFLHILGFSFLDSAKLVLACSYVFSGISMYLLVKNDAGDAAAFVASLLYLFAPIRFIQMHFVASVGSSTVYVFIPLTLLFAKKALDGRFLYIALYSLNFLFLVLSHSSATMVVIPISLAYAFIKKKALKQMIYPILALLLGIGLTAFYVLPMLIELRYTWLNVSFNKIDDFKIFFDYFYSYAGYGLMFQDHYGKSILFIGYSHLFILLYTIYYVIKNKYENIDRNTLFFLILVFLLLFIFLQSFTSTIWNNFYFLRSFQASGRLFAEIAFILAFLGGIALKKWNKLGLAFFCTFVVVSTILNWQNRKMVPFDSNAYYNTYSYGTTVYSEYFDPNNPVYALRHNARICQIDKLLHEKPTSHLKILSGKGEIREISRSQIDHLYLIKANTELELSENTYYFPGWKIYANAKQLPLDIVDKKNFGTLTFSVPKGTYVVEAKFEDTDIRKLGKFISAFSFLALTMISLLAFMRLKIE
jgi:hypothetical protein